MLLSVLCLAILAQGGWASTGNAFSHQSPHIIGGEIVQEREFPGLGSLTLMGTHYCAVCILNSEWAFTTAASMTFPKDAYKVVVGTNHLDNGGTVHELSEMILHEDYNISDSWINNIALLKVNGTETKFHRVRPTESLLNPPIQFGEGLAPVSLPQNGQTYPVGTSGLMAGWGQIEFLGPVVNDLRKIAMTVSDHKKCEEAYAPIGKHVYSNQICAESGVDRHGPLFGDGADPMFVDGTVIGIASWERGANALGYPVVMTKISDYIDWINEHMSSYD
ncbi:hypothetical protein J437_LFUL003265 [Ladona fulva]|uniref:Peptidase S1 domain-containing protein n=1 Tax=Ladona fulva TaxID=123851 RepID=A0A8K0JU51_LADFU|nr:hypothetical protein J437_LFUL003265 [Ladona fulva]